MFYVTDNVLWPIFNYRFYVYAFSATDQKLVKQLR